jgi:hypothetical protein
MRDLLAKNVDALHFVIFSSQIWKTQKKDVIHIWKKNIEI